ncbi:MAG: alanine racemase, partial [Candidatus Acidiferrales bacterium]
AQRLDCIVEEKQNTNTEVTEAQRSRRRLPILIEVRLAPEESKHGVEPGELARVVERVLALPHVNLRGLMCIPPWCENPEDSRPYFRRLRELRDELRERLRAGRAPQTARSSPPLQELSMGMSHDFEVAIEEGATQVRVGTAIFGERT